MEKLLYSFDLWIFKLIALMKSTMLGRVMVFFSQLGDGALIWIVIAVFLLLNRPRRRTGLSVLLALLLVLISVEAILKNVAYRPRPFDYIPWQKDSSYIYPNLIIKPEGSSFPSSYAASSVAAATAIFIRSKLKGSIAITLAAAICFSQVYCGLVYFTDVISGIAIGIICGKLASLVVDVFLKIVKKRGFKFTQWIE